MNYKTQEALKLALSTLEGWANHGKWVWPESALEQAKRNTTEAITAIREALADSALERIAENERELGLDYMEPAQQQIDLDALGIPHGTPFQPAQQEPVAYLTEDGDRVVTAKTYNSAKKDGGAMWSTMRPFCVPLYTSPPTSKPWVGLTDEEFQWIYDHGRTPAGMMELAEAKLREKNA